MSDNSHSEAIDILSQQVCSWFKQIDEMARDHFPDAHARSSALRQKAHAVQRSIKALEASDQSNPSDRKETP